MKLHNEKKTKDVIIKKYVKDTLSIRSVIRAPSQISFHLNLKRETFQMGGAYSV